VEPWARIVVPVDFSERSAGAVRYAKLLAQHFHSELDLLHVFHAPELEFGGTAGRDSVLSELYQNRSAEVERALQGFLADELDGLTVRRVVSEGDTARRIVEWAHQQQAGLIVMATHGYGPFRRFILGSNTAKVLHDADCPVWTGAHLEEQPRVAPFHTILVAVDLSPQSRKTIEWAARLQKEFGARLVIAHVVMAVSDEAEAIAASWFVSARQAAQDELLRLQRQASVEATLLVESGEPARAICALADKLQAGVLVIGRGSAAGSFGRLRTNAYAIIRQSPCPVVSV
jgi:nucleotide-binding universal stress UspA family protein